MEMTDEQKLFLMKRILDNISDGVFCVDLEKRIFYWNYAAEKITGYTEEEMIGKVCDDTSFRHMEHTNNCAVICPVAEAMADEKIHIKPVYVRGCNGEIIEIVVNAYPIVIDGNIVGAVEIFAQKSMVEFYEPAEKLEIKKLRDPATDFPDRSYISYYIESKIQEKRHFENPFIVTFIKINNLDNLIARNNKTIGDEIIKALGDQIKKRSRQSDLIGRWDRNTLVGVFASAGEENGLMLKRELYNQCMKVNVIYSNRNINIDISVGLAFGKNDDILPRIIKRAEKSLHEGNKER